MTYGDSFHRFLTSFGGFSATQVWADYVLWEELLNDRPHLQGIVELGTFKGGFSRYLWAQTHLRGMTFATFDKNVPDDPPPGFAQLDVFENAAVIQRMLIEHPVALLCDGGDKPRETALFAPWLPDGSLLVVHDWQVEFTAADVPAGYVEVYGGRCDELGAMSRAFERA